MSNKYNPNKKVVGINIGNLYQNINRLLITCILSAHSDPSTIATRGVAEQGIDDRSLDAASSASCLFALLWLHLLKGT